MSSRELEEGPLSDTSAASQEEEHVGKFCSKLISKSLLTHVMWDQSIFIPHMKNTCPNLKNNRWYSVPNLVIHKNRIWKQWKV